MGKAAPKDPDLPSTSDPDFTPWDRPLIRIELLPPKIEVCPGKVAIEVPLGLAQGSAWARQQLIAGTVNKPL